MGRWAQAARRGGAAPAAGPVGPPAAPTIRTAGIDLLQDSNSIPDVGGTVRLYRADTPGPPYTLEDGPFAWSATYNWGELAGYGPGYYVCTETGNGVDYVGESAFSNEIQEV